MRVRDDGRGFPVARDGRVQEPEGRMGLTGMRERMLAVGGIVLVANGPAGERGADVQIAIPVAPAVAAHAS
jgi:signal transduction histidine kinase